MKELCCISLGKIKKATDLLDWKSLLNKLDVNEQVSVFNETIMDIMSNFVPNELINEVMTDIFPR